MDILYIDQLIIMARIGVHNWEKKCFQKLIFDLKIFYKNTYVKNISLYYLDYIQIRQIVFDTVNIRHFFLIEDVAEVVVRNLINKFAIISRIQIKVSKPGAMRNANNVGVYIDRKKLFYFKKPKIYIG